MRLTGARVLVLVGAIAAALILSASPALAAHGRVGAAAGSHPIQARIDHRLYGLVPSARAGGQHSGRPSWGEFARSGLASGTNLSYHGGPVMQTNTTYAIYWQPSGYAGGGLSGGNPDFSSPYQTLINQFLGDVAAAKNATTDTYAVDTQYYSGSASSPSYIQNSSTFGNSAVDTDPLPADQCSSEYAGSGVTVKGCVTDAQLQAEIAHFLSTQEPGWTPGPNTEFFVFMPRNLGSCVDTYSGECSYTYYCAYHSNFNNGSGQEVLYANQPYTETNGVGAPGVCASGQYPNGDAASDSTINVMSHEHNETITDPLGTSWYDSQGNEIGDKCAWNFGTALGSTGSGQYNQVINGHDYYLQQEWSNASSGCALKYGSAPSGPPLPVAAVTLSPSTVSGGNSSAGTVTLNGAAPSGGESVTLSSTSAAAQVPASVSVAGGATSATFTVTTSSVSSQTSATISASASVGSAQGATLTINPLTTTTLAPSGATISTGSQVGGSYQSLAADDGIFFQVGSSGRRSNYTTDWYGTFTGVPATLSNLKVTYDGANSRSATETIYIYNWSTASWSTLKSSTVGGTETVISNLAPSGSASNYVSSGQVRVRVRCTAGGTFTTNADQLIISYSS